MIRFKCDGYEGVMDREGFVRWGSIGFHIEDVVLNPSTSLTRVLEDVYLKALFDSIRI